MNHSMQRRWVVRWIYVVALGHLLAGMVLTWFGDLSLFAAYHRSVAIGFWPNGAPAAAHVQQLWWINLFGATVQCAAVWMAALIRLGDQYRSRFAWATLIAGVLLWAPQDVLISMQARAWIHVWVDTGAVLTLLPPLGWLWFADGKTAGGPSAAASSIEK